MASSNSGPAVPGLELEDFSLLGKAAQTAAIERQPGFAEHAAALRQEGYAAAKAEAAQERRQLLAGLGAGVSELLERLQAERAQFQRESGDELLALALALARRVLRAEARTEPEQLRACLDECLASLGKKSGLRILLSPDSAAVIEELSRQVAGDLCAGTPYTIEADPQLAEGDIIVEGGASRIESICAAELERLAQELLERFRGAGDDES